MLLWFINQFLTGWAPLCFRINQWPHHIVVGFNILSLRTPRSLSNCSWDPRGDGFREAAKTVLAEQRKPLTAARTNLQDAIDKDLAISPKTICAVYVGVVHEICEHDVQSLSLDPVFFFCNLRFRWLTFPHWWLLLMPWLPRSKHWKMRDSWDEKPVFEKTLLIGPKRSMNQDQTSVWSWKWMKRVWYPTRNKFWIHVGCHKDTQEEEHNIFHCWQSQYIRYQCNTAIKQWV